MKIPFKKVNLGKSLERITPLIESGNIGLGSIVGDMEKALAEYVGAKEVIAVDSCTSALFLSLKWEFMKGKTIVGLPSMTVPLVAMAALEAGMSLKFHEETDWVGSQYELLGVDVIDSAHELRQGQYAQLLKLGVPETMKVCFSFYPTKTIGSADGGAIATDDSEFAAWARSAATYGRVQGKSYNNSWEYDVEMIGYKRHYTNLQAAIVIEQLSRLNETNAKRAEIVNKYNHELYYSNNSDYLYRINIENDRDGFIKYMLEKGIECGVHFKPLHLMTPFKDVDTVTPEAIEAAYRKTVSLPLYDLLTDEEVDYIIQKTLAWIKK